MKLKGKRRKNYKSPWGEKGTGLITMMNFAKTAKIIMSGGARKKEIIESTKIQVSYLEGKKKKKLGSPDKRGNAFNERQEILSPGDMGLQKVQGDLKRRKKKKWGGMWEEPPKKKKGVQLYPHVTPTRNINK